MKAFIDTLTNKKTKHSNTPNKDREIPGAKSFTQDLSRGPAHWGGASHGNIRLAPVPIRNISNAPKQAWHEINQPRVPARMFPWREKTHMVPSSRSIFGADRPINGKNLLEPLGKLARRNSITRSDIYIITGSHGSEHGNEWTDNIEKNLRVGRRRSALIEQKFYDQDFKYYGGDLKETIQTCLQGRVNINKISGKLNIDTVRGNFNIDILQGNIDLGLLTGKLCLDGLKGQIRPGVLLNRLNVDSLEGLLDMNNIPLRIIRNSNLIALRFNSPLNDVLNLPGIVIAGRYLNVSDLIGIINLNNFENNLNIDLLKGYIEIDDLQDNLNLNNIKGSINLSELRGEIDLGLLRGRTYIELFSGELDPTNLKGEIDLRNLWGSTKLDNLQHPINLGPLNTVFDLSQELDKVNLSNLQNRIKIINIGPKERSMTSDQFINYIKNLNRTGHVILAYCFSRNDEALRFIRNEEPVPSYL